MKRNGLEQLSIEAKERGMTYGKYMTYLATHHDERTSKKAPYQQERFKEGRKVTLEKVATPAGRRFSA